MHFTEGIMVKDDLHSPLTMWRMCPIFIDSHHQLNVDLYHWKTKSWWWTGGSHIFYLFTQILHNLSSIYYLAQSKDELIEFLSDDYQMLRTKLNKTKFHRVQIWTVITKLKYIPLKVDEQNARKSFESVTFIFIIAPKIASVRFGQVIRAHCLALNNGPSLSNKFITVTT